MRRIQFIPVFLALFITSCEDNGEEPGIIVAEELIASGWVNFESEDYSAAVGDFNLALDEDSTALEAYSGIGWSQIRLDQIDSAQINFIVALDRNYAGKEILAGLAAISLANEEYTIAIVHAKSILSTDADWVFEHDNSIDYNDLWLIVAIAYFHEGDFTEMEAAILNIDSTYSIDENDSATWIVGSNSFNSYQEAVAAYLQQIGGDLTI